MSNVFQSIFHADGKRQSLKNLTLPLFRLDQCNHLRPGVNFINVFTHSFYARRSQKQNKLLELTVFYALLGSGRVKAVSKMLVKNSLGRLCRAGNRGCSCRVVGNTVLLVGEGTRFTPALILTVHDSIQSREMRAFEQGKKVDSNWFQYRGKRHTS